MYTLALAVFLILPAQNPEVLIILADDIGVDRVGCYGDTQAHTPVIDALAAQGARFTSAYVETVCSPSRAAILTGIYPHRFGMSNAIDVTGSDPNEMLPLGIPGIPQQVMSSIGIGKWHLANQSFLPVPSFPFTQGQPMLHPIHPTLGLGFDSFRGTTANPGDVFNFTWWVDGAKIPGGVKNGYLTSYVVDEALAGYTDEEVVYVAFHVPHKPFHVPPTALHTYPTPTTDLAKFRAATEAMDTEIGRLIDGLDPTYVIFLGDNGTPVEVIDPGLNPLQSKGHVYEGGIHVPLIVTGPGILPGVRTGLVHGVDVAPTVVQLAGYPADFLDGQSFTAALFVDPAAGRRDAYFRRDGPWNEDALRMGRWKLIRDFDAGIYMLFDIRTDPGELVDVSNLQPVVLARLMAQIETY